MLHVLTGPPVLAANPIAISVPTLLIEVVIFLGMVFLLDRLVFDPIRKAWRERDALVQAGLQASTDTRLEAEEAHAEVRRILGDARRQAQKTFDEVSAEADRLRTEQLEQALAEFHRLVEEARVSIQAEQALAGEQMRNMVIDLALEAASRVTGRSYDIPEARQLAADVIARESLA